MNVCPKHLYLAYSILERNKYLINLENKKNKGEYQLLKKPLLKNIRMLLTLAIFPSYISVVFNTFITLKKRDQIRFYYTAVIHS